jgi:hypothetical protein
VSKAEGLQNKLEERDTLVCCKPARVRPYAHIAPTQIAGREKQIADLKSTLEKAKEAIEKKNAMLKQMAAHINKQPGAVKDP